MVRKDNCNIWEVRLILDGPEFHEFMDAAAKMKFKQTIYHDINADAFTWIVEKK